MKKWFSKSKSSEVSPAIARSATLGYRYPQDGTPGPRVYEEMLLDPVVRNAVTVKKLGALAPPWRIVSGGDERKLQYIETMFAEMDGSPETVLYDALDAVAKGYSVLEKTFGVGLPGFPEAVTLRAVKPKDPALFGFDVDEFLNVRSLVLHVPGEPPREVPRDKFIVYVHNRRYMQPYGDSDLRAAYKHWRIKRALIDQWSAHLEKYASPAIIGKFKRGISEEEQAQLLQSLDDVQRQSALVHPDDVDVSLLDGRRSAESGYLEAIEYHNREIARTILGQTLTTDDSRKVGSLALGRVHLQVMVMLLTGVRRDVAESVIQEQVIRPLIDLNFGPGSYPTLVFQEPTLDVFRTGDAL